METILNVVEVILFILSIGSFGILLNSISTIVRNKGYSTSIWSNPTEIVDFIVIIRKEKDKKQKRDYRLILIATIFLFVLTFGLAFVLF